MRTLIFALTTFSISLGFAATKQELKDLLQSTEQAVDTAEIDYREMRQAEGHLIEAKRALYSNETFAACYEFAYEKLFTAHTSSEARNRAKAACKEGADLNVLRFAYEKYYVSNPTSVALEKAAAVAKSIPRYSYGCIENAFEKYFSSNSTAVSMDKAFGDCR